MSEPEMWRQCCTVVACMRCRACEFADPEDGSQDILIRNSVCMVDDNVPDACRSCNVWQEELELVMAG